MKEKKKIIEVLNDLIRINLDRIAVYEKAVESIEEGEATLRALFNQLSDESQRINEELSQAVLAVGGGPAEDGTLSGKIYHMWIEIKDSFSGDDVKSTMESCEFGEHAAQKAYAEAVKESKGFPENIRTLIQDQKDLLKISLDLIRHKCDEYQDAEHKTHY